MAQNIKEGAKKLQRKANAERGMKTWGESWKVDFSWNSNVKIFLDGEQVTGTVKVRDTHEYDSCLVDWVFGYSRVTSVHLVSA